MDRARTMRCSRFSAECLDQLAARDVKAIVVACNTSSAIALPTCACATTAADHGRRPARRGRGGARHPYRPRWRHRDGGDRPITRLLPGDQGRKRLRARSPSTPRRTSCRWSRRASWTGRIVEEVVGRSVAPIRAAAEDGLDTLLLGCTHYPLLAPVIERQVGGRVAIIDSASATASRLATCSRSRHSTPRPMPSQSTFN